jgi:dolichol-phosphate mannosyltransferase
MLRGVNEPNDEAAVALGSLAIAAPAHNEADGIEVCVRAWVDALEGRPGLARYEISVCDDGSTDGTGAILERLAREHSTVRPQRHEQNRGGARALSTAIAATTADWILVLDSDGQFPIDCLDRFEAALRTQPWARAFIGARTQKRDSTFSRFGARMTTLALNALYGVRYRDLSSACQLVYGPLLRSLPIEARGLNYSVEMSARLLEAGVHPVEVDIEHAHRASGRSTRRLVQSSFERAGLVGYLTVRRALQRTGVLAEPHLPGGAKNEAPPRHGA